MEEREVKYIMFSYKKEVKKLQNIVNRLYTICQIQDASQRLEQFTKEKWFLPHEYALSLSRRTGGTFEGISIDIYENEADEDHYQPFYYHKRYVEILDKLEGWRYKRKCQQTKVLETILPWSLAVMSYLVQIIQILKG